MDEGACTVNIWPKRMPFPMHPATYSFGSVGEAREFLRGLGFRRRLFDRTKWRSRDNVAEIWLDGDWEPGGYLGLTFHTSRRV